MNAILSAFALLFVLAAFRSLAIREVTRHSVQALLDKERSANRASIRKNSRTTVIIIGAVVVPMTLCVAVLPRALPAVAGLCGAILLSRQWYHQRKGAQLRRSVEFYLPVVVERLVMAVESGLDVLPAIDTIVRLEEDRGRILDPVTRLFALVREYVDQGAPVESALESCARSLDSLSARHALVHLAIAYREGGELMAPLRELSDATQTNYQEQIEEEIAKLAVKATLPLLCTFAGLLVIFLTLPMIQIVTIAARSGAH